MSFINDPIQLPSPVFPVHLDILEQKNITLFIKRDDLIHPNVSGNKYRKLKYNLIQLKERNIQMVISFGGAFSNHLHALAASCHLLGLNSIGIIRGEIDDHNPTLNFCRQMGMQLYAVSRQAYRQKENAEEVKALLQQYKDYQIIPEGGSNNLSKYGVSEVIDEVYMDFKKVPDYIVLPCGTGGTTAGLLWSTNLESKILSFSALKSEHLYAEVMELCECRNQEKLTVVTDYHFGGYAKWNEILLAFIADFESKTQIPLDHVYNGKAMYGLLDLITKDYFTPQTTILYLHTGGLQGKAGLDYIKNKDHHPI